MWEKNGKPNELTKKRQQQRKNVTTINYAFLHEIQFDLNRLQQCCQWHFTTTNEHMSN